MPATVKSNIIPLPLTLLAPIVPSLTIYQAHADGMVSIDALVPLSVATAMLAMLAQLRQKPTKRR